MGRRLKSSRGSLLSSGKFIEESLGSKLLELGDSTRINLRKRIKRFRDLGTNLVESSSRLICLKGSLSGVVIRTRGSMLGTTISESRHEIRESDSPTRQRNEGNEIGDHAA